ncbi:hypothetical protein EVAR_40948_1 [Eumeta japonica]|uniref:Uncharacterized protein n=1 Tax=Eumeta variegata TaxID=151549 RepID=A0A4C1X7P7_EUMVA|nr:hypothetical protein EVAR_40948_1 [Eumeta japonica]
MFIVFRNTFPAYSHISAVFLRDAFVGLSVAFAAVRPRRYRFPVAPQTRMRYLSAVCERVAVAGDSAAGRCSRALSDTLDKEAVSRGNYSLIDALNFYSFRLKILK